MSRQWRHAPGRKDGSLSAAALTMLLGGLVAMATSPAALAASGAWQPIGPSGGVVNGLAIDPAAPATVYAGTCYGGLFKTIDGGRHWAHSDAGLLPNCVTQVAVDPVTTSTIFAATGRGVWSSLDGGATWTGPASGLGAALVTSLVIDPRKPNTLYSGGDRGVWKSVDGGASWFESSAGILRASPILSLAIDPRRPATLYAGTVLGVFRSLDHGARWRPARTGMVRSNVFTLAVDPLVPDTVYAGMGVGLFVSNNRGASWIPRKLSADPTARQITCLAVSPAAPRAAYACSSGAGVFKSTDGGKSWSAINAGLGTLSLNAVAIDPTLPDRLYAGAGGVPTASGASAGPAVYKSASGGAAWTAFSNGIDAIGITALAVDPLHAGTLYAGTAGAGIYASTDDGGHWAPANAGLRGTMVLALAVDPLLAETLYAETERGFFASADGARRWSRPGARFDGVPPMVVQAGAPATLFSAATGSNALFKTVDGGATWSPLGAIGGFGGPVQVAIAPSDQATLYVETSAFVEPRVVDFFAVSHDGGATFQSLSVDLQSIRLLAVDPITPTTLYLASPGGPEYGLWKSVDGGQSASQLPGIGPVSALLLDPADPQIIYAGTSGPGPGCDVLVSRDGGATWSELAPGLPGSCVVQLAFGAGGSLYAGTQVASIWRLIP